MDDQKSAEGADVPAPVADGKDELNLAEFPLSCVADRSDRDQKTLTFEDKTFDEARGQMITRRLTITGSDKYGVVILLEHFLQRRNIIFEVRVNAHIEDVIYFLVENGLRQTKRRDLAEHNTAALALLVKKMDLVTERR